MTTKTRAAAAITASLLALTIAACGGDAAEDSAKDDATGAAASADAAEGPKITAESYSYNAPEGWETPEETPGFDFDSVAAESNPGDDGFANNINVLRLDPAPVDSIDELEKQSIDGLETVGIADLDVRERESIDGADAIHLSGGASLNDLDYVVEQFSTLHEGSAYFVTFSFTPDVAQAERDEIAASVLATWRWTS